MIYNKSLCKIEKEDFNINKSYENIFTLLFLSQGEVYY